MSAIFKNQNKNVHTHSNVMNKTLFIIEIKDLITKCELSQGKQSKMIYALKIYKKLNQELSNRIDEDGLDCWINFIARAYEKTSQFILERDNGDYFVIDKNIVDNFFNYVFQVRNFTSNIIKNYCGNVSDSYITRAKEEITRLESGRPRRNIKRVNYTGMDTIEPECEADGITDIWLDLTLSEDPDYVFEEDEDDEEEDRRRRRRRPKKMVKDSSRTKRRRED